MADEVKIASGVSPEHDQAADDFYDTEERDEGAKMKHKIEALEHEKISLLNENGEIKEEVGKLTAEIDSMKSGEEEMRLMIEEAEGEFEENTRAMEAISKRNVELETEVSRLQHDLLSSLNGEEEANAAVSELKRLLGQTEVRLEEVKKEKSETEKKVRELERKVGILEVRETEESSKRVRFEEEMKETIGEKEREVVEWRKRAEELGDKLVKKAGLEERLSEVEGKLVEAERVVCELKERKSGADVINGIEVDLRDIGLKGPQVNWPVVAIGSAGVVAVAAAIVFVCRARKA